MSSSHPLPVFVQPTELNFVATKPNTHTQVLTIFNPYEFPMQFSLLSNTQSKYKVTPPKGIIYSKCYVDIMIRHLRPIASSPGSGSTISAAYGSDCLRIQIYLEGEKYPCGHTDVPLSLTQVEKATASAPSEQFLPPESGYISASSSSSSIASRFKHFTSMKSTVAPPPPASSSQQTVPVGHHSARKIGVGASSSASEISTFRGAHQQIQQPNFYWVALISLLVCIITLLFPTHSPVPVDTEVSSESLSIIAQFFPNWLRPSHSFQLVAAYVLGLLTVYFFVPYGN